MTSQPTSTFPAMASHGNPGDLVQGGRIGELQRPPHRRVARLGTQDRAWWASTVMSVMPVAPSAIATAMDISATPRSTSGNFPLRASADPSAAVSPAWLASFPRQHRPGVPDQALVLAGHRQPVIPAYHP